MRVARCTQLHLHLKLKLMLHAACYLYTNRFGTPATVLAASVYPLLAMFFVMTFILTVTTPDVDTLVTVRKRKQNMII